MSDTVRWTSGQATRQEPKAVDGANLADILERVLDKGIVIAGDIQVNLLDIELLTIKIRLVVASVDRAKEMGIDWWERDPTLSAGRQELEDENDELRSRIAALESAMARTPALAEPDAADGEDALEEDLPEEDLPGEDLPGEDPADLAEPEIEDVDLDGAVTAREEEDLDEAGAAPDVEEDPDEEPAPAVRRTPAENRPRRRTDDGAPRRRSAAAASGRAKAPAERPAPRRRKSRGE